MRRELSIGNAISVAMQIVKRRSHASIDYTVATLVLIDECAWIQRLKEAAGRKGELFPIVPSSFP